ncbi:unnamed protein product [Prunus armeniaca]
MALVRHGRNEKYFLGFPTASRLLSLSWAPNDSNPDVDPTQLTGDSHNTKSFQGRQTSYESDLGELYCLLRRRVVVHTKLKRLRHGTRSFPGDPARRACSGLGFVVAGAGASCLGRSPFFFFWLHAWAGATWDGVVNGLELAWVRLGWLTSWAFILSFSKEVPSTKKTQVGTAPLSPDRIKHLVSPDSKKIGGMRNIQDILLKSSTDKLRNCNLPCNEV